MEVKRSTRNRCLRISQKAMGEYLRRKYGLFRGKTAAQIIMDVVNEQEEVAENNSRKSDLRFRMDDNLWEELAIRAGEQGCSRSEFVGACLEKATDERYGML